MGWGGGIERGGYPMHDAFAVEKGHGGRDFKGGHGHSAKVCHPSCGAAAGSEPPLLHCILHATQPTLHPQGLVSGRGARLGRQRGGARG